MKVGDLVVNTYIGAPLRGIYGLVIGLERFGEVLVIYGDRPGFVHRLSQDCLEVVSVCKSLNSWV